MSQEYLRDEEQVVNGKWADQIKALGGVGYTWNPKQQFINSCFNWMISNLYIGNGCFTKHPFLTGGLGFQVCNKIQGVGPPHGEIWRCSGSLP